MPLPATPEGSPRLPWAPACAARWALVQNDDANWREYSVFCWSFLSTSPRSFFAFATIKRFTQQRDARIVFLRILGVSVNLAEDWNRKRRNNQNYGKFGFAGGCGYLLACAGSFFGCFSSNSCRANMSAQRDQNSKTETKTSTSMNMCRS